MQGLQSLASAALLVALCFPRRMQGFVVLVTLCQRSPLSSTLGCHCLPKAMREPSFAPVLSVELDMKPWEAQLRICPGGGTTLTRPPAPAPATVFNL